MSANHRYETISDYARRGNLSVRCIKCGRRGVVDGPKAARYFSAHGWDGHHARAGRYFRCIDCHGHGTRIGLTIDKPTVAEWGPKSEADWKALVKRLRG